MRLVHGIRVLVRPCGFDCRSRRAARSAFSECAVNECALPQALNHT